MRERTGNGGRLDRKGFLKRLAATVGGLVLAGSRGARASAPERRALPTRRLGRSRLELPILALGGHHLGLAGSERAARELIDAALEGGVRLLDNAESYHAGRAERWMGAALVGRRADVVLMTKTYAPDSRSADSAKRHLEGSLRRLRTDYLDLWQLHSIQSVEDVERAFGPGGAMETILRMKQEGVVRLTGVTGHRDPAAHRRALRFWDEGLKFDVMQLPLNPLDYHQRSFQREILPELRRRGIGVIAMKTSAGGALLREGLCSIEDNLRYVWSLPVDVAVVGMETPEQLRHNVRLARGFTPLDPAQRRALLQRLKPHARLSLEWYKAG